MYYLTNEIAHKEKKRKNEKLKWKKKKILQGGHYSTREPLIT